jgi:hypothetical protein
MQAIDISFPILSLTMLFGMSRLSYLTPNTFLVAVGGLISVLMTVNLAGFLQHRLTGALHRISIKLLADNRPNLISEDHLSAEADSP